MDASINHGWENVEKYFFYRVLNRDIKTAGVLVLMCKDSVVNVPNVFLIFLMSFLDHRPQTSSVWMRWCWIPPLFWFKISFSFSSFNYPHSMLCWPSFEPIGRRVCAHGADSISVCSAAEARMSGRNSPRNLANCSHKLKKFLFLFFFFVLHRPATSSFFFFLPPTVCSALSWQLLWRWHGDW